MKKVKIQHVVPVLPSSDIERDVLWCEEKVGFTCASLQDGYAVLFLDGFDLHLQWHSGTKDDPILGGSVFKLFVDDIENILSEMVNLKVVSPEKLHRNTPWGTHKFGFFDLNKNAIFFVQDI